MLSVIHITCPHCGASGKVSLPPIGALVIGPCPKCSELVMVFSGHALPIDREIVMGASPDEKHTHLMEVLHGFLNQQVERLVTDLEAAQEAAARGESLDADDDETETDDAGVIQPGQGQDAEPSAEVAAPSEDAVAPSEDASLISQEEFDDFVRVDLQMLDNKHYFRTFFE